jgi:hypothetical protein
MMFTPDIGLHPDAVNLAAIAGAGVKNHRTTRVRLHDTRIKIGLDSVLSVNI